MDLIPKPKPGSKTDFNFGGMKSQGISIYKTRPELNFLRGKKVVLSFLAVILVLAVWGGIKAYSFFVLEKQLAEISFEIVDIEKSIDGNEVKKLVDLDKTIVLAEDLLARHIYNSNFFILLQDETLPLVQWGGLSLQPEEGRAELSGKTVSFSMLAKQIISFESSQFNAEISDISLGENGVEFSAFLNFDPGLLLRK
jgi:hypothetical protein